MVTLALPLLLSLAQAAPPAAPLAGCTAEQNPKGWDYECGALHAAAKHYPSSAAPTEVLDATASAYRKKFGPSVQISRERRRVAGRELDALRANLAEGIAILMVVQRLPEGLRVLTCASASPASCDPVFDALGAAPWRAGPVAGASAAEARPLQLLGRPVKVPDPCVGNTKEDVSGVACPPVYRVLWSPLGEDAAARATDFEDWALDKVLKGKRGAQDVVSCTVQGAPARCRRLRVKDAEVGAVVVLTTPVERDGEKVLVSCITPGDTGASVPCSLVVELK